MEDLAQEEQWAEQVLDFLLRRNKVFLGEILVPEVVAELHRQA
jgi:hypothetical protein